MKRRCICSTPAHTCFAPEGAPEAETVRIGLDEYEVIRLMDFLQLSQEQCAERIGVSRATVARMYENARRAIAETLVLGKRLIIEGGDVVVCTRGMPECAGNPRCCHCRRENHEIREEEPT